MLTAFYILVVQQILQGIYSLWGGFQWLRYARRRLATHPGFYAPRVALICPCKGTEQGLEENLAALTRFDYPSYEIFFSLASATDPARALIEKVAAASTHPAHVVIAGPPKDCGEKVNNLRAAVERAGEAFEVFVFTDSDIRPGRHWITRLVAPLADTRLGAATTFRWTIPLRGGFWSAVAAAWNAPIATMLGEHTHNFCWGGGTAIRRAVFEEVHGREFWHGAVSDDLALTRALQKAGRAILFVPECLAPTLHDTTARELLEFTDRQIIITRVYAPRLWALGGLTHLSYCGTLLFAAGVLLGLMIGGDLWSSLALVAFVIPLLAALKGALRLVAVTELLPEWSARLRKWNWVWILLAPLVPFLYLWNCLTAALTRQIRWRGIRYQLISPDKTRILSR
jgi:ceramide glucosyltransferase